MTKIMMMTSRNNEERKNKMIPKELYPTPANVAHKMLSLVDFRRVNTILEPSAGNGDLAREAMRKYDTENWRSHRDSEKNPFPAEIIDLVEIDDKCAAFLRAQGGNVIADDFLRLKTFKRYDLIVMNPPFSEGAKHLLKAVKMQKYGGQIVCLLNAETINNPYTLERKMLLDEIEKYGATVTDFGNCFATAERPTEIKIYCVYFDIPKGFQSDILDGLERAEKYEAGQEQDCTEVSTEVDEYINAILGQYQRECEAGLKLINECRAVGKIAMTSFDEKDICTEPILKLQVKGKDQGGDSENRFLEAVRYKYWSTFFNRPEISRRMTGDMQNEFLSQLDKLKYIEFNLKNIAEIRLKLSQSTVESIEKAIMDLFHEFARDHSWYSECAKNIHHYYNGWATNKCGVINKKVIIPLNGFSSWSGGPDIASYNVTRKLADVEKVFSYLDTGMTEAWESVANALQKAQESWQTQKIELKYFTVTFYKKGTTHIVFKDMEILKRFNIFAGQREGGLPPSYGKKTYGEMSDRERAVIDEFEGEESYAAVMAEPNKYLIAENNLLMLT